ncbi:MAG TPA: GNAT family N-acetyltransferase [Thermoleophilaceae bacterium]|jgi:GNAT superfamily N-acetyltransferase
MIGLLDAAAAQDDALVARLARLVNDVYTDAEDGLWREGAARTQPTEIAEFIEAGQIAVAKAGGEVVGVVRIQTLSDTTAEFGMLAAEPEHRGIGVGRGLIEFAERHARDGGSRTMQLELLVPRRWRHPTKAFLDDWYRRIGYRVVRTTSLDDAYPELAPQLATSCDFVIYEKPL